MSMYELYLGASERERFKEAAKQKMLNKGWTMNDLAKHTDRPVGAIYSFFRTGGKPQRFLAAEIYNALEMNRKDWC